MILGFSLVALLHTPPTSIYRSALASEAPTSKTVGGTSRIAMTIKEITSSTNDCGAFLNTAG
jgi:hypothetical protein